MENDGGMSSELKKTLSDLLQQEAELNAMIKDFEVMKQRSFNPMEYYLENLKNVRELIREIEENIVK